MIWKIGRMPSEIINFPFQGNNDKCLVLSNSQWAATGIGQTWKRLRIGIRFCVENITNSSIPPYRTFIGLMSNPVNDTNASLSNGYLSASRNHMIGFVVKLVGATLTVPGMDLLYIVHVFGIRRIVYNTISDTSSSYEVDIYGSLTSFGTKRFALITEVTKSVVGPSYDTTWQIWGPNWLASYYPSYPYGNLSLTTFLNAMLAANPLSELNTDSVGWGYAGSGPIAGLQISEDTNGPLNAIHIAWGIQSPRLAISDVSYAVME